MLKPPVVNVRSGSMALTRIMRELSWRLPRARLSALQRLIDFSQARGTRIVLRSQAFELMQLRVADAPAISEGVPQLYLDLKRAGVSAELHVLTRTGHGFGIRDGNPPAVSNWTSLFYQWLDARGFLKGG